VVTWCFVIALKIRNMRGKITWSFLVFNWIYQSTIPIADFTIHHSWNRLQISAIFSCQASYYDRVKFRLRIPNILQTRHLIAYRRKQFYRIYCVGRKMKSRTQASSIVPSRQGHQCPYLRHFANLIQASQSCRALGGVICKFWWMPMIEPFKLSEIAFKSQLWTYDSYLAYFFRSIKFLQGFLIWNERNLPDVIQHTFCPR